MRVSVVKALLIAIAVMLVVLAVALWNSFGTPQILGIESVRISEDDGPMGINCEIRVYSPNLFSFTCKKLDVVFRYDGKEFASGNMTVPAELVAQRESFFPMRFTLKDDISDIPLGDILGKDSIPVTVEWKGSFSFLNINYSGSKQINLSRNELFSRYVSDLVEALEIKVANIGLHNINLDASVLSGELQIKNIISESVSLRRASLYFFLDEGMADTLSRFSQEKFIELPPGKKTAIPVELQIRHLNIARWGTAMITDGHLDCFLTGHLEMNVGNKRFQAPISLTRIRIHPFSRKIELP